MLKVIRPLAWLLLAISAGAVPRPAAADDRGATSRSSRPVFHELRFGVLAHDVPGLWSGFRLERGINLNGEVILSPSLPLFGGRLHPAIGASIAIGHGGDADRSTSTVYADARWIYEFRSSGWFAGLGLGIALHNGKLDASDPDRKALGSRALFHVPFEIGYRFDHHNSVSVYFDHVSNGGARAINEGLDTLGVRYGYRY